MKQNIVSLLCLLISHIAVSQSSNCDCPENNETETGKPRKVFSFTNGNSIGICGDFDRNDSTYSEFILYRCGEKAVIGEWDATQSCTIKKNQDTLLISDLYQLAIGKNESLAFALFYITKLYFKGHKLITQTWFRKDLPRYSKVQVQKVLKQYQALTKNSDWDSILLSAHRLFWAYVSGSKSAELYFQLFEKKFGPFDGAIAEEFDDLWATYQHFKEK